MGLVVFNSEYINEEECLIEYINLLTWKTLIGSNLLALHRIATLRHDELGQVVLQTFSVHTTREFIMVSYVWTTMSCRKPSLTFYFVTTSTTTSMIKQRSWGPRHPDLKLTQISRRVLSSFFFSFSFLYSKVMSICGFLKDF